MICWNLTSVAIAALLPLADTDLQVGFSESDITPKLGNKPVYMAGFGHNRRATGVLDPLKARAVVLQTGKQKVAFVSVDLVGLFHAHTEHVRAALPGYDFIIISSTHNHEGPDSLGLWGASPFSSGVDPAYLQRVEQQIIQTIKLADQSRQPVTSRIATAKAPGLLHDSRKPIVKHDDLVALQFVDARTKKPAGLIVQWNCHPEALGRENTEISADFVTYTVRELQKRHQCPVVYLTGTVGGLMTSVDLPVKNGTPADHTPVARTKRYGRALAQRVDATLAKAKAVRLTPFEIRSRKVFIPLGNKLYQLGWRLGVLNREAYLWKNDPYRAEAVKKKDIRQPLCMKTEVAWLRLGEVEIAAMPGEIYPELVVDKVENPAQPGADFPKADIEPAVYKQMAGPYRMIIGLANDEIGYIIPKRQWDQQAPFCYGRKKSQYGEINSCGPETAPILTKAFRDLVKAKK